jgi:hypothetical protein
MEDDIEEALSRTVLNLQSFVALSPAASAFLKAVRFRTPVPLRSTRGYALCRPCSAWPLRG